MTRYLVGALAAGALALAGCNNRAGSGYSGNAQGNGTPSNGAATTPNGANTATASGTYGSANPSSPGANEVGKLMHASGTVKDTGGGSLTLVTPNKGQIKLNTDDQTAFVGPGGEKLQKDSIQQGAEVRAAYRFDGKNNQAYRIEVTQMPAGSKAGQGQSGSQSDQNLGGQGQNYGNDQ
jgi:hypothetical protein